MTRDRGGEDTPAEHESADDRRDAGGRRPATREEDPTGYDLDDVFIQLERLESTVTDDDERREIERTRQMLRRIPGGDNIHRYTSQDIGEAFVGGVLFALPLLVESGVFEIAAWLAGTTVGTVPVLLVANVAFTVVLTAGLLYAVDDRAVRVADPVLGFLPRRLVGGVVLSLAVAGGMMAMWGRLHAGDPTGLEQAARVSVVWVVAALGAVIADVLPEESRDESPTVDPPGAATRGVESRGHDIEDVFTQIERLESTVTDETEKQEVEQTRRLLRRISGGDHIRKYTSRDIGEAFVGGALFALPLLVEGGVFEIAAWLAGTTVGTVPVLLVANVAFTVVLTAGLLYAVDVRTVRITEPVFGFLPRRLIGVLVVSLVVAAGMMAMWGRLHAGDPTGLERVARVSVVWVVTAVGAVIADILPGESQGEDIGDLFEG